MALLEINLRKPALMEEVVSEDAESSTRGRAGRAAKTEEKDGGGSALGKLAMVGFIVAALVIARAVRSRRSSSESEPEGIEVPIEDGSSESGGQGRRIAGIVLAVLGAVALARRMQSGERQ